MAKKSQEHLRELLEQPDFTSFVEELQMRLSRDPEYFNDHGDEVVDMTLDELLSHGHEEETISDLTREEVLETVRQSVTGEEPHPDEPDSDEPSPEEEM